MIKQVLGFPKRSHNSHLLEAVGLDRIQLHVKDKNVTLLNKAFSLDGQYSDLCRYMISKFILTGATCKNTLIDRIVSFNISPLQIYMSQCSDSDYNSSCISNISKDSRTKSDNGNVDSLKYLVFHNEFNKLGSTVHTLAKLLVKAF